MPRGRTLYPGARSPSRMKHQRIHHNGWSVAIALAVLILLAVPAAWGLGHSSTVRSLRTGLTPLLAPGQGLPAPTIYARDAETWYHDPLSLLAFQLPPTSRLLQGEVGPQASMQFRVIQQVSREGGEYTYKSPVFLFRLRLQGGTSAHEWLSALANRRAFGFSDVSPTTFQSASGWYAASDYAAAPYQDAFIVEGNGYLNILFPAAGSHEAEQVVQTMRIED